MIDKKNGLLIAIFIFNSLAQRVTRDGTSQTHLHSLGKGRGPVLMGVQTWILNLVCCKHKLMCFKRITDQLFWNCPWIILHLKLNVTHTRTVIVVFQKCAFVVTENFCIHLHLQTQGHLTTTTSSSSHRCLLVHLASLHLLLCLMVLHLLHPLPHPYLRAHHPRHQQTAPQLWEGRTG